MQVVIDIPDAVYNQIKEGVDIKIPSKFVLTVLNAIKNGTPLPKGHGRLVDADILWDLYHDNDYDFYEALDDVQTIVEAESEE